MTDRHKGYVVALENDIREDDAQRTLEAIAMIRGVLTVKPIVNDPGNWIEGERARREIGQKVFDVIFPGKEKS